MRISWLRLRFNVFDHVVSVVYHAGHVPTFLLLGWGVPFYLRGFSMGLSNGTLVERFIFVLSWLAVVGFSVWFWVFVLRAL